MPDHNQWSNLNISRLLMIVTGLLTLFLIILIITGMIIFTELDVAAQEPSPTPIQTVGFATPTPFSPTATLSPPQGPIIPPVIIITATPAPPSPTPSRTPFPTWTPTPTFTTTPGSNPVPPTATPAITDWRGEYWPNPTLSGSPALVRNDRAINFNWGDGSPAPELPADNFSARWSRQIEVEPGVYRFLARADDGVRILVDGRLVLDEWHANDASNLYAVDVVLDESQPVVVEYFEATLGATIEVWLQPIDPVVTPSPTALPEPEEAALNATISHLAALTRLPTNEIEPVSIEPVDWPDSLLGCPPPGGVAGAPVVTPGYRIFLMARGELYEYHTDREGRVVLCEPAPSG
jgi:mannan endo-1,4-beta-mannosidase